ncbi:hypothetical protein AMD27_11150 [Acinetobacter sp. TGL-Y2]|uniref:LPS translocon maturation chaperone LptM n=1 Tax=Acinetobacter sp. TGL-Y2 TaxID=1407071 RepID=UPI0007A6630D|nr:lipoprotein [Acinetobacter sp. TGL-Y2]AMW79392.1 hypothetical protein AMD27_11150 [Acinetobacter sp. TGL-Y2]
MRIVICCMSIWATTVLVGCGQTGALQLPNDPNYDKRAQYLLYKNNQAKTQVENQARDQTEQAKENKANNTIDQPAASDITE